jgi:cytochrome c oxidase subunit 2
MKLIGWAIALAAAGLTPAAAQAPASSPAENATAAAPPAAPAAAPIVYGSVGHAIPTPGIGMPDGRKGLQEQVTPLGREAAHFHNVWLLLVCAVISAFVLGLLLWVIYRYRRGAHPVPSRNSHNTAIEVVWTLVPVLILVGIAVPSIGLLRRQYTPPPADLTVKITGHQWYWSYEYPDNGVNFDSHMLKEANDPTRGKDERARTDNDGPPLLAADERMVLPEGKVVKFIITADDVIHSFSVPAFWTKLDANPGQLNETWVKVDRAGVYFGQCSELCGARHGFMPINVEVVKPAQFAQWIASKGGKMPSAKPAPAPDSTGASPVSAAAVPAAAQPQPPQPSSGTAVKQPATNQAATAQN